MENKPKYTPGPWVISPSRDGEEAVYGVSESSRDDGSRLITVHTGNPYKPGCYTGESAREARANAALIAAAPELLEALKKLEARVDWFLSEDFGKALGINYNPLSEEFFELEQARAAIAKAEGK